MFPFLTGFSASTWAASAVAVVAAWAVLTSFVSIREYQVGGVVKRFSRKGSLPEGRIVALNGEAGYQAATLAPGIYFGYWVWQYKIEKYRITVVEPGHIGLVMANDGEPMPVDRVLSSMVECDYFQDGPKFLRKGGQKGRQSAVLTAGFYRIHPVLFKVQPAVKITNIESDKVGIVTVLDGAPMPIGQMAAQPVSGHDSFQNPEAFVQQRRMPRIAGADYSCGYLQHQSVVLRD